MKASLLSAIVAALMIAPIHAAAPPGWTEDYAKAIERAKAEKKNVLLDFTGSDWCGWCIKIDEEVFETPKFKSWAKQNLVLVKVDFPRSKPQTQKIKEQNSKLKSEFGVRGYPTLVIVNVEGKEIWRQGGYKPGGPAAFIASVEGKTKSTAQN